MTLVSQQKKGVRSLLPTKDQLLTIGDLENFKDEMLNEIKQIVKESKGQPGKKWLKSTEVKNYLGFPTASSKRFVIRGLYPTQKSADPSTTTTKIFTP